MVKVTGKASLILTILCITNFSNYFYAMQAIKNKPTQEISKFLQTIEKERKSPLYESSQELKDERPSLQEDFNRVTTVPEIRIKIFPVKKKASTPHSEIVLSRTPSPETSPKNNAPFKMKDPSPTDSFITIRGDQTPSIKNRSSDASDISFNDSCGSFRNDPDVKDAIKIYREKMQEKKQSKNSSSQNQMRDFSVQKPKETKSNKTYYSLFCCFGSLLQNK